MSRSILSGFLFLTVLIPLWVIPSLNEIYVYPKITFLSLSLAVLVFVWTLKVRFSPQGNNFSSPLLWPILLFLGLNFLSLIKAVNVYEGLYHVLWLIMYVVLFFFVINNLNIGGMERVIYWSIIAGVIVSAIGIGQFWGWQISFLPFRLGSTLGTKNMSAQSVILILPLTFIGFFFAKETKKELFYGLCAAVMGIFLIYSKSRGSWVAFIGAFVFMLILGLKFNPLRDFGRFWQLKRKKMVILSLCAGLVVFLGVAAPYIIPVPEFAEEEDFLDRFQSIFGTADLSAQSRLAMAANTLEMIKDHYLLGVGAGNWKFIYPLYSRSSVVDPTFTEKTQPHDAHNDWVQMPAEIGLGFIAFLWLILSAYKMGWRVLASSLKDPSGLAHYRALTVLFLLFSISALLIDAFFDFPFKHPVPLFYFWVFLGFLQILTRPSPNQTGLIDTNSARHRNPPPPPFAKGGPGGISATCRENPKEGGKPNLPLFFIFNVAIFLVIAFAVLNLLYLRGSYHFMQGMILFKKGQIAQAISNTEKAVSFAPFEYRYYTELGRLYYKVKQYDKVALASRLALLYHPNYLNAWNNLGVAFSKARLFSDAEKSFQKALHIYPDYYQGHVNLGNNYWEMGEIEKAKREYQVALSIKPDSQEVLDRLEALEKPR